MTTRRGGAVLWLISAAVVAAAPAGYAAPAHAPAAGLAVGAVDAVTVISAVLAAPSLVDYEGTKVVTSVRGERAETVTILESSKRLGKLRLEFLSPESVSGRQIVDDGVSAWQYEPSLHLVVRGPSFVTAVSQTQPADILQRYDATVLGSEEVVGRQTVVLVLVPKAGGWKRQVWVDQATGVILRTEERDTRGAVVFVSFFTRISYSLNLPAGLFQFRIPAGARLFSFYLSGDPATTPEALRQQAGFSVIAPVSLPPAYRFKEGTVSRYGAFMAASAVYTDGVTVLSVFQTPTSKMAIPQAGVRIQLREGEGRLLDLGYFRVLMWQAKGLSLAIVGTLPPAALVTVADALNAVAR